MPNVRATACARSGVTGQVRNQLDALGDVLGAVKGPALELFLQEIAENDVNGLGSRAFHHLEGQPQVEHALRALVPSIVGEPYRTINEFVVQPVVHGRDRLVPCRAVQVLRMRWGGKFRRP